LLVLIEVLFDHPDFVIVNKPSNISVQNESNQPGILPILCQQLKIEKLWLVHRLDKVTSGILILAKHSEAAAAFGHLFEQKQIEKFYLAISTKKPKKKQGTIKGGMKKVRDGQWMLDNTDTNFAHSQFFSFSISPSVRLFLIKPLTGKTHQIRVALKSLGSPILGDCLYKAEASDRVYLHAYCIRLEYQGQLISVRCSPDVGEIFKTKEFDNSLKNISSPWLLPWPKYKISAINDNTN
jgi:tRNA pseudouridine32 synthase/23S rRNA pseudouridine746 synthase